MNWQSMSKLQRLLFGLRVSYAIVGGSLFVGPGWAQEESSSEEASKETQSKSVAVVETSEEGSPPSLELDAAEAALSSESSLNREVVIVCGHPGDPEYGKEIIEAADRWIAVVQQGGLEPRVLGYEQGANLDEVSATLSALPKEIELWLVMLGHGTFDGKVARYNLVGKDLSAGDLNELLGKRSGTTVILNTTAASGPFMRELSGKGRVCLTATKSGGEVHFTRLGKLMPLAFTDLTSARDHDGQVSLLEAFLSGAVSVAEFYREAGRISTEHALLDDNEDGKGSRAEAYRGLELIKMPTAKESGKPDGKRAHQLHLLPSREERSLSLEGRARRNELEAQLDEIKKTRASMSEEVYYNRLEPIFRELAELYLGEESAVPAAIE